MYIRRMKQSQKYDPVEAPARVVKDAQPSLTDSKDAMVRTQIYLSRAEHAFLQAETARSGTPMAAIIRSFIDEKMEIPSDVWTNNPMLRSTPVDPDFETAPDAALNHDHYLTGAPKKWIKLKGQWVEAPPLPVDYYENAASYEAYNGKLRAMDESR